MLEEGTSRGTAFWGSMRGNGCRMPGQEQAKAGDRDILVVSNDFSEAPVASPSSEPVDAIGFGCVWCVSLSG